MQKFSKADKNVFQFKAMAIIITINLTDISIIMPININDISIIMPINKNHIEY